MGYFIPNVVRVFTFGEWTDKKYKDAANFDIALLILDKPLGLYTGWFGLGVFPEDILKY
jgi:hypothetical protein